MGGMALTRAVAHRRLRLSLILNLASRAGAAFFDRGAMPNKNFHGATCRREDLRREQWCHSPSPPPPVIRHARSRSTRNEFAVAPAGGSIPLINI
eukprot:scaffold23194_cov30-Tisochrysis_lutea.AAC.3